MKGTLRSILRRKREISKLEDKIDWEAQFKVADRLGLRGYKPKHFEECRYIWKTFVPKQGQADCVQGELLREIEKLRHEACSNGNINWDDNFAWFCGNIYDILAGSGMFGPDELKAIREILGFLKENGEYAGTYAEGKIDDSECDPIKLAYTDDDLYDYLADAAAEFYLKNKKPIAYEHKDFIYR